MFFKNGVLILILCQIGCNVQSKNFSWNFNQVLHRAIRQATNTNCILPTAPINGYYTVNERSDFIPGKSVFGTAKLQFFCKKGYQLNKDENISCNENNKWNGSFPLCLRACTPLVSSTVDIKCSRNELEVDCAKAVLHGTQAEVSCKQYYHLPPFGNILPPHNHLVCENGAWNNDLLQCVAEQLASCKLPPLPANGRYTVNGRSDFIPGTIVSGSVKLEFFCKDGYQPDRNLIISCSQNNRWNRPFPVCLRTCSPRISSSLNIKCSKNGLAVDCTKPVLHGTHAEVSCKQFYYSPPYDGIPAPYDHLICDNGVWNFELLECVPACGKKNAKGSPNIIGGDKSKLGEYPWHVGVYIKINVLNTTRYSQLCGGSIINPKVVISAAHCFENREPENYGVGAGKYYRLWNDKRDVNAQLRSVEKIYIPEMYKGIQHNYANDIAVIIVDKPFEFHNIVNPVCVDWTGNIDKQLLVSGSDGYVAGWGLEEERGDNSIELKHLQLSFVPYDTCNKNSPPEFRPIVALSDKICAGRTDGQNVCEGDSGGGLAFQSEELFYLMAIVSIGPNKLGSCDSSKYTTFTKLSHHAKWAENLTRLNYV